MELDLLIRDAHVVTCAGPDDAAAPERLRIIAGGAVGVREGRIAMVADAADAAALTAREVIDAGGRVLLPGLVDPHTHLVFAGSRVDEFARKMAGEDYRAIAAGGGGIAATVRATRAATMDELFALACGRARAMLAHGVTTVEVKSGYGLTLEHELALLDVGRRIGATGWMRTTTSLLAAHAIPPERRDDRTGWVDEIVARIVPEAARRGLADACDVYLDEGAFDPDEARRVLDAARSAGLAVRGHVGQFRDLAGAELLSELGALSGDHLEHVSEAGIGAMARAGVSAVLLPGAWRTLRQKAPDAARFRAAGVRMAIGTDCNPGTSPTTDLWLCAALAVRDAGMTAEEALLGVTAEAARAAGASGSGRIEVGTPADLALFDAEDPRGLVYALGDVRAARVWVGGARVHDGGSESAPVW